MTYQVRLSGALRPGGLEWALRYVTGRHDGLLMRFATDVPASALTGGPEDLRHVRGTLGDPQANVVAFEVVTIDGSEREPAVVNAALAHFAGQELDLAHGPRVRALLLQPAVWQGGRRGGPNCRSRPAATRASACWAGRSPWTWGTP